MSADIGLVGLAVMGENLVLNMERHGFTVAVYNRTTSKVDDFLNGRGKGLKVCVQGLSFCANGYSKRCFMLPIAFFWSPLLFKTTKSRRKCPHTASHF